MHCTTGILMHTYLCFPCILLLLIELLQDALYSFKGLWVNFSDLVNFQTADDIGDDKDMGLK